MSKKCVICDKPAKYSVKGTSDFYCIECAEEHFADLGMLQRIEEEAKALKRYIEEKKDYSKED